MKRAGLIALLLGLPLVIWLARHWIGVEIVPERVVRPAPASMPLRHDGAAAPAGWYSEMVTGQMCRRSRWDC